MFERIARGWSLTKASFKVLSLDKEIIALPLLAAVVNLLILGVALGFVFAVDVGQMGIVGYLILFAFYVAMYATVIFFNAATVEMATIRFNGGDPTLKDGLRKSWSRIGRILQWAVIAATVGLILQMLRDQAKDNIIARILVSFLEFGWNVAVFFVVPVLVYQDVGPFDAIKGSMGIMKKSWGESLTGVATTGIIFMGLGLLGLIPILIGASLFSAGLVAVAIVFFAVAVAYWVVLAAVNSAVDGILVAGLYKWANEGVLPEAFTSQGIRAENLAW
ncbi:MAG: hypothetical protein QOE90_1789 [Thermoplasmata archaeon]|jgi:hypothetical protein|nr:hypothetical protein [Thermoplasmata archaeon]